MVLVGEVDTYRGPRNSTMGTEEIDGAETMSYMCPLTARNKTKRDAPK
jgi:hypothetical protein